MKDLTPRKIVAELDRYIVGQADAKRAVAVAVRNRWRRQQLPEDMRRDVSPKNILMIGPTGVGKTEIARRLAGLVNAPFVKVEATKYTEVGYHGRDVDGMIRDLLDTAISMVRAEMTESVKEAAEKAVEERLLDELIPGSERHGRVSAEETEEAAAARRARTREKMRQRLRDGSLEDQLVEVNVEERVTAVGMFGQAGMEMDVELQSMVEKMMPARRETKRMSVREARRVLFQQEADKLIEKDQIYRAAIERTEQSGIVFLDEIDKVAGSDSKHGPDVSRQGVQRDLLPIVEGSAVVTKYGTVRTDYILFIAAGAFHSAKPSDLMPELQGRFPIRVELQDLSKDDFVRILTEPRNALTRQQQALLQTEGVSVEYTDGAIQLIAQIAYDMNRRSQNIGARRLYTILERVFEKVSFEAPEVESKRLTIDEAYVRQRLDDIVKDEDLSRFIL